jgi:hypothetical protein
VQFLLSHDTYQLHTTRDLFRHISAANILRFVRLIELQQDYHVCHNSRRILKQRKQNRMQHWNLRFVEMLVHYLMGKGAKHNNRITATHYDTHLQNNNYFTQNANYMLQEILVFEIL